MAMSLSSRLPGAFDDENTDSDTGSNRGLRGPRPMPNGTGQQAVLDGIVGDLHDDRSIPRKPVPNEAARSLERSDQSPRTGTTVRNISRQSQENEDLKLGSSIRDVSDLVPHFAQLETGARSSKAAPESNNWPLSEEQASSPVVYGSPQNEAQYRHSSESPTSGVRAWASRARHRKQRSSLDKSEPGADVSRLGSVHQGARALAEARSARARDVEKQLGVSGTIDLQDSADTTVHERMLPAVTHETIRQDVHEIVEERVTREIHQDHIYHRILPIADVEVLPARHYVPDADGILREVPQEQLPGRAAEFHQRAMEHTFKKMLPKDKTPPGPRQFTAARFRGTDGATRENVTPEGVHQTEQWWVHPPTVEQDGMLSGQTQPLHLGSRNPKDDGLRTATRW